MAKNYTSFENLADELGCKHSDKFWDERIEDLGATVEEVIESGELVIKDGLGKRIYKR